MKDKNKKLSGMLFAIDIDGTLLDEKHQITPRTLQALQALNKHAYISLVSARPLPSVLKIARAIGLEGPMVALNGGIMADVDGHIYHRQPLPVDGIENVIENLGDNPNISLNFYSGMDWIVSRNHPLVDNEANIIGFSYDQLVSPEDLGGWIQSHSVEKILVLHSDEARKNVDLWSCEHNRAMTMAYSKTGYFEVTPFGSDKASALRSLADYYQVPLERTIAIGDGHVDIPMLKISGKAVVMANSSDEVKSFGDIMIGHHNKDGLACFLETYILSNGRTSQPAVMGLTGA